MILDSAFRREGREHFGTVLGELLTIFRRDDAKFAAGQPVTGRICAGTETAGFGDRAVRTLRVRDLSCVFLWGHFFVHLPTFRMTEAS